MKITEKKLWNVNDVREACIRNDLYTRGDNEEYFQMFNMIEFYDPTPEAIQRVAEDIARHSVNQTVTNVMFILANEVVRTCYTAYDDNGNEIDY